jgi:hypothetical protein
VVIGLIAMVCGSDTDAYKVSVERTRTACMSRVKMA